MKTLFPGYFKLSEADLASLWKNGKVVFDANILLNLYRYSEDTTAQFLKLIESVLDRVWVPHQAAHEYLRNRLIVITQQETSYRDSTKAIKGIENQFKSNREHPFLSADLLKRLTSIFLEVENELEASKARYAELVNHDPIQIKLAKLLQDCVGTEYLPEKLNELCKSGAERLKNRVPPGFKDDKDDKKDLTAPISDARKYGDYILWSQILDHAREQKIGVILVTDDRKEDWWHKHNGKTVGPRPELVKEFADQTKQLFCMYKPDTFMEAAEKQLKHKVEKKAIDEVRDIRKSEERIQVTFAGDLEKHERRIGSLRNRAHEDFIRNYRYDLSVKRNLLVQHLAEMEKERRLDPEARRVEYNIVKDDLMRVEQDLSRLESEIQVRSILTDELDKQHFLGRNMASDYLDDLRKDTK